MHSAMIEMIRPALLSEIPSPFLISWSIGAGASQANDCAVSSSSSRISITHLYGESLLGLAHRLIALPFLSRYIATRRLPPRCATAKIQILWSPLAHRR